MLVAAADVSMLQCTIPSAADQPTVDGGTQHHPL